MSSILSKLINLAGNITGILPVANGGTNSSTSLNNNRFIISSSGAIVEASAVTASRVVVSDSNGLPATSSTTTTQVQYLNAATGTTGTTSTNLVFSTSPTLVTPILGTPTSGNLSNCTAYPAATISTAGTITKEASTTFTATFTQGGGFSQGTTCTVTRFGNMIFLQIPAFSGTATATSSLNSGASDITTGYRPVVTTHMIACVKTATSTFASGNITISTAGGITIYATADQGSFTSGQVVGLGAAVTIFYVAA